MLFAQLLDTGRHGLPLREALALLWAVGPWREELRQLLELLPDRADHRLYPLPWAALRLTRQLGPRDQRDDNTSVIGDTGSLTTSSCSATRHRR